uniref:LRRCT domain-containing protein n=2 Tax=Globodera pallida TaxID=36090 RepID=A0A183BHH5_GLOPA
MSLFAIFLLLLSIPCSSIGALISPSRSLSARHDMCPAKCECQKSYSRQKQQQNGHYEEGHGHQHSATESSTKAEEEQLEEEAEDNEDVQLISVRCVRGGLNDSEFLALLQSLPADVHELEVRGTMATRNNFQWNDNINRLSRLSRLVLSNSDIPALSQSIRLPLLRVLDLSGNNLEHIQLGSFLGMPMLERLDLSRNRISVLPTGAFIYLKVLMFSKKLEQSIPIQKLSSLSLSHNRLNRELTTGNLLRGPRGLRELELDGNRLSARQLNEMFGDLGTLTRLEVNYCGLNDAAVWTLNLSSVPELRRIGLAGNNLSQVPSTTLRALALLDTVDLSHNLIRTLGPCAFCGSNISRVLLGHNLLGLGDDFRFIHREAFADTHILELDLSYNQLRSAGFNSVMLHGAQESLEVLHLSGNDHLTLDGQQLIGTLPHLKELHVADSELGSVPYSLPKAYGQLTLLNLSGNGLDLLPPNLGSMFPQLHVLDLLDNKDVLRYDETLCAEPVMLRGQPMHRVQKINDCAILFGANYGITQNTELLLILGALLLAALLLSVVLALLLYCGRERNQKGTYVTGEGVGEEGDGKKMTTTTTMMSKSTTLISNGMAAGGGGRGLMDLGFEFF